MRKNMMNLAKQMEDLNSNIYFTEDFCNDEYAGEGYRYFFLYRATHKVYKAWKTQASAIDDMEQLIEERKEVESKSYEK